MDLITHRTILYAAVLLLILPFLSNSAHGENWYCTLTDDNSIAAYGKTFSVYSVANDKLIDTTGVQRTKEMMGSRPPNKYLDATYTSTIIRNDAWFIVAESDYTSTNAYSQNQNIVVLVKTIDKRNGAFVSSIIYTSDNRLKADASTGICAKGVE